MINIQADNKNPRTTIFKGGRLSPFFKMWESLRTGLFRYSATKAQGKITIVSLPTNGQIVTIGTRVYTWQTTLTNSNGNVQIGGTVAQCITNLINAINLDGAPGSQYSNITTLNTDVSALLSTLSANDIIITALVGGTAGNSIVLSTTMTAGNVVDGATLGTFRAGANEVDADTSMVPARYGAFATYQRDITNSGGTSSEINTESMYNHNVDQPDGDDNGPFLNSPELMTAYPRISPIMASNAVRKIAVANYIDRMYTKIRLVTLATLLKDVQVQTQVAPYTVSTSNVVFNKIVLDTTRFVLFYTQAAGTTGTYAVAGNTAADGSVTYGTPVLLDTNSLNNENFGAALINTDKIAFTKNLTSSFVFTQIMTISTVTISLGTAVQTAGVVSNRKCLVKLDTDKYLTAHIATTTIVLTVHTVSGTTITVGSNTVLAGSGNPMLAPNGTDKAQLAYTLTSTGFWQTLVVTVAGTTPGTNTPVVLAYDGTYNWFGTRLYQVATDKFLFYSSQGKIGTLLNNQSRMRMGLITVATTTSTVPDTSRTELRSSYWDTNCNDFIQVTAGAEYIWYRWENARISGSKIAISGNVITPSDCFMRGAGYRDQDSARPYYRGELWTNLGVMVVVPTTNGYFFYFIQNDTGGTLSYFADKSSSFDIRLNDDLLGTYTKTYPALLQPFNVAKDINAQTFNLSIKNNDSQSRFVAVDHVMLELD